jgi:hypothetical protein
MWQIWLRRRPFDPKRSFSLTATASVLEVKAARRPEGRALDENGKKTGRTCNDAHDLTRMERAGKPRHELHRLYGDATE